MKYFMFLLTLLFPVAGVLAQTPEEMAQKEKERKA